MIKTNRVNNINNLDISNSGDYIVLWIQSSLRTNYNYTLSFAKHCSEILKKPLLTIFILNRNFPDSNTRSFNFLFEGLLEFKENLKNQDLTLFIAEGDSKEIILNLSKRASLIITDKTYLKNQRDNNSNIAKNINVSYIEIEGNLCVPIEEVSDHEEYGAYTIRKKITSKLNYYFNNDIFLEMEKTKFKYSNFSDISSIKNWVNIINFNNIYIKEFLNSLKINNLPSVSLRGGEKEAESKLKNFINNNFLHSGLSPFLHFGHISPIYIAKTILESSLTQEKKNNFLEELIVRRELAFNFCYFNTEYNNYDKILPNWCYKTLTKHLLDKREYLYTKEELENYQTHDKNWNKAQETMIKEGIMNSYLRMYWAKKIFEWSANPKTAYEITIYLNNKYFLDGRDPNSYAGVAWCYGKHDRPWKERSIFGMIRYMSQTGLEKKLKNMEE